MKGMQESFLKINMKNLGLSQRKFANKIGVSRRTLRNWIYGTWLLPENIFEKCLIISPEMKFYSKFITAKLPENWGMIKGGNIRSKMKTNLNNELRAKGFRKANSRTIKKRFIGPKGEKMYNQAEKRIAEILFATKTKYQYEPFMNLGKSYAFPDFLIKDIIIERCGYGNWNVYWERVKKKFQLYDKYFSGKTIMIVPPKNFEIALQKVAKYVKNIIIIKENELEVLSCFAMGL
jgi:lambda repressor-like predicted transcriptional regulator